MTPDSFLEWIKVAALIACIFAGAFAVFSPSWVWLRKHAISTASVLLAFFGVILLSAPVYQTMQIKAPGGYDLNLAEIQEMQENIKARRSEISTIEAESSEFVNISNQISDKLEGFESLGGSSFLPVIMPESDLITALQTGTLQEIGNDRNVMPFYPIQNLENQLKERGFFDEEVQEVYGALVEGWKLGPRERP